MIVVGARSYIGACMVGYARSFGLEVVPLTSEDCDLLSVDSAVSTFEALADKPSVVVFLAVINKSVANSFESFGKNLAIVRNFIAAARRVPVESVIYFSSVDVYGREPALPITEASPTAPDTWYGLSKYACEWMLRAEDGIRCPVTVLRIPGIYGTAANDRSVIGRLVAAIRTERRAVIQGSGAVLRDYVYVRDVCRLVHVLLPFRYDGVLNVATGHSLPLREIVRLVASMLEQEFNIVHDPADPAREFDLVFDVTKLKTLLPDFGFSSFGESLPAYRQQSDKGVLISGR